MTIVLQNILLYGIQFWLTYLNLTNTSLEMIKVLFSIVFLVTFRVKCLHNWSFVAIVWTIFSKINMCGLFTPYLDRNFGWG